MRARCARGLVRCYEAPLARENAGILGRSLSWRHLGAGETPDPLLIFLRGTYPHSLWLGPATLPPIRHAASVAHPRNKDSILEYP